MNHLTLETSERLYSNQEREWEFLAYIAGIEWYQDEEVSSIIKDKGLTDFYEAGFARRYIVGLVTVNDYYKEVGEISLKSVHHNRYGSLIEKCLKLSTTLAQSDWNNNYKDNHGIMECYNKTERLIGKERIEEEDNCVLYELAKKLSGVHGYNQKLFGNADESVGNGFCYSFPVVVQGKGLAGYLFDTVKELF